MCSNVKRIKPKTNKHTGHAACVAGVFVPSKWWGLPHTTANRAEDLADLATEQRQDTNNNNSNKNQNKRILDEALAFFFREETTNHCNHPLYDTICIVFRQYKVAAAYTQ